MKKRLPLVIFVGFFVAFGLAGSALATTIKFDEVDLYTENPLIGEVQFYAGPNQTWDSTITSDWWNSGNPYLASGLYEVVADDPVTFIGAEILNSKLFASVSLDMAAEDALPGGSEFMLEALSGATVVDSKAISVTDDNYYQYSLTSALGFDTFRIYDGVGNFFHIDNVNYTEHSGGPHVPEPGTMLLLLTGLAGVGIFKKRGRP